MTELKKLDKEITNKEISIPIIHSIQIQQLEKWCELKCHEILFDTENNDNWVVETSLLTEKIIGKKQITFLLQNHCWKKPRKLSVP